MANVELVRQSLISCLHGALPAHTPEGYPSVLGPDARGGLWAEATLPYNLRLADTLGPLAVVYPQTHEGIAASVECAKTHNVPAIPRSGGHSYGAYSLGGSIDVDGHASSSTPRLYPPPITPDAPIPAEPSLIIDMRAFRAVNYNFHDQTVRVGAGALLGELSTKLEKVGRMIPCGSCPTVGVGGQAVAGGFGLTSRSQGLLLDNMLSAEVVLADGRSVMTSKVRHPDLYWAIRGGGSSFGIAHSFVFRTHPAPKTVIYYELTLLPRALPSTEESVERATNLFLAFQEYGRIAPANLGLIWHVTPDEDGKGGYGTKVEIMGQWMGSMEEYEVVMKDFNQVLEKHGVGEMQKEKRPLTYLQSMLQTGGNWTALPERGPLNNNEHVNFYAKSLLTRKPLARPSIKDHMEHLLSLAPRTNPSTSIEWFVLSPYLGGQHSAILKQSNAAFGHRDLMIVWEVYAKKLEKSNLDLVSLVRRMSQDLTPVQAVYPAYVDPELTASEYPRLVWGDTYPRLQALKRRYDPSNVFRFPQSVRADQSFPWASLWLVMVASAALFWIVLHFRRRRAGNKVRRE